MSGKETMTVQILSIELKQVGVEGFVYKARIASDLIPAIKIALSGGDYWGMEAAQTAQPSQGQWRVQTVK
jgi:DNA-binding NarL/FixJ family response regulator